MNILDVALSTASRRDILAGALLGAVPAALITLPAAPAAARPFDPKQTIIEPPVALRWTPAKGYPARSVDRCGLTGSPDRTGLYYVPTRWWPGYMSAPHTYTSDAFCMVLSGTWWCNGGPDFDPAACVPVRAGSYVRRPAGVPQYDGVVRDGSKPAVIAICGVGPVDYKLVDPSQPGWRQV